MLKLLFSYLFIFPIVKLIVGCGGTDMKMNLFMEANDKEEIKFKLEFFNELN